MGTHYNVLVFDDHLGMLDGRSCEQEAEHINAALEKLGMSTIHRFRYICEADCIAGEFRNIYPDSERLASLWGEYDAVYFRVECDSELKKIDLVLPKP